MSKFNFNEPVWVADFREFIGLDIRLVKIRPGTDCDYYEYNVISPTSEVLFTVGGGNNTDRIGYSNGPFCDWHKSC